MNNMESLSVKSKALLILGIVAVVLLAFYIGVRIGNTESDIIRPKNSGGESTPLVTEETKPTNGEVKTYTYTEAGNHIGEYAKVTGTVVSVYASKGGTTFVDFCKNYKTCPFTAVIFASSAKEFTHLKGYTGPITIEGTIKSYQGKAQIILDSKDQIEMK